ncbi:MAG: hypothetical protein U5L11_17270 [Arhodomonas sp.]|nr:hypothetical protein [Arhodomonas sp.]
MSRGSCQVHRQGLLPGRARRPRDLRRRGAWIVQAGLVAGDLLEDPVLGIERARLVMQPSPRLPSPRPGAPEIATTGERSA